ncbi:MAG: hypothetical protein HZB76_04505 [Chlamydiae bacterium]|nr:hypothetical protein [Chlamydiota bacterium]
MAQKKEITIVLAEIKCMKRVLYIVADFIQRDLDDLVITMQELLARLKLIIEQLQSNST